MDGGLSKLLAASEQLEELNKKLEVQKVVVTEKTEACEKLLKEITEKTAQAEEKKELAVGKREEIAEEKEKIQKEKVSSLTLASYNPASQADFIVLEADHEIILFSY